VRPLQICPLGHCEELGDAAISLNLFKKGRLLRCARNDNFGILQRSQGVR